MATVDINLDTQVKGSRPPYFGLDSGAANAYVVTTTAPLGPSLRIGSKIIFIALHANTGASTLAVNGGAAIAIKKNVSTALASGDISANQVVEVVYDGTNFQMSASAGGGGGGGVTSAQVQQEAFTYAADTGAANAYAVTLSPAPTLVAGSVVQFKAANANSGASTLAVNGGSAMSIVKNGSQALVGSDINAGQIVTVIYDGTNFQLQTGAGGSGGTSAVAVASALSGKPGAGQLVAIYTAYTAEVFPANFASPNSYGTVGTNPTATATYNVYKNGSAVGTISISTSGVFTFSTSGGASFTLNAGDRLTIVAPGSQDATLADVGITLVGTRTGAIASGTIPIFTWRGGYGSGVTYQPWDVVAYTVSGKVQSYVCKLLTIGNAPTNTTYWDLLAQSGADGTTSATEVQQEAFVYAVDSGSANAYAVTLSPAPTIVDGSLVVFRAANANTGASTLNVNSGGAVTLKKQGGTALAAGDIAAGQVVMAVYDGTNSRWEMVGGGAGGDTTAKYIIGATDATLVNAAVWPALYNHADIPPVSPNTMDDEFDAGSLNGRWTLYDPLSLGITLQFANSYITMAGFPNTTNRSWGLTQPAPGGTWKFRAKIGIEGASGNYFGVGLMMRNSGVNKALLFMLMYHTSHANGPMLILVNMNGTTYSSESDLYNIAQTMVYLEIGYDGTNLTFKAGSTGNPNGIARAYQVTPGSSFMGTTPDQVGICVHPYNNASDANMSMTATCDWFRREA